MQLLSNSGYCEFIQCPKISWLSKYKPEEAIESKKDIEFENIAIVKEYARKLFENYENITTNAYFKFNNLVCNIDILKKDEDGIEIYDVRSSSQFYDTYIDEASYKNYILSCLDYNVKKIFIVLINNEYVRQQELELDKLFNIEDITLDAISRKGEVASNINKFNIFMENSKKEDEPNYDIGLNCKNRYLCNYWEYCIRNLPKPNIFDVSILGNNAQKIKFEKYYQGKVSFEDLQNEDLSDRALEQINFELNDLEPKIDKEAIKEILNSLKYPLYFLDYETYRTAIPEIIGTKPYQQLTFQYSLHIIEKEGAPLQHKEFLADINDKDFIRHFAESLIKDISKNGSVIIYNKGFEPARNMEIAKMYPDLKDELDRINSNIVDFMVPFKQRKYYTKEMKGSASIKSVLPALYPNEKELNYHNLPLVHNGEEASKTFLELKNKTIEEQEKIRQGLLVYCKLDTYAMVKIWEKFKEVIEE